MQRGAFGSVLHEELREGHDGTDRIIDLVGDTACERSNGCHFFTLKELGLKVFLLGDVFVVTYNLAHPCIFGVIRDHRMAPDSKGLLAIVGADFSFGVLAAFEGSLCWAGLAWSTSAQKGIIAMATAHSADIDATGGGKRYVRPNDIELVVYDGDRVDQGIKGRFPGAFRSHQQCGAFDDLLFKHMIELEEAVYIRGRVLVFAAHVLCYGTSRSGLNQILGSK